MATTNSGTTASETFAGASPVSGAAPTDATDGQPLEGLSAITVAVVAASGVTLSGAGTLDCYYYDPKIGLWGRAPSGDLDANTAGVRTLVLEPVDVLTARNGRIKWIPTGVTFSAGSAGVTVYQLGFAEQFRGKYGS